MAETKRKSHIKRIYKDDDPESDQWIDIERLDELSFTSARKYQYRLKKWTFDWDNFSPDGKGVSKKKIVDPNDETNWVEVPVRNRVIVNEAAKEQWQSYKYNFKNDDLNRTRKTHSRRVYHHDIGEENLNNGEPPSDPEDYLNALGDQDIDQYVDVELLDNYWSQENESKDPQGKPKKGTWQKKKWKLSEADPLLKEPMLATDEADPSFVPINNPDAGPKVDPPWRLDPLQNIVNVNWGDGLAVIFGPQDEDAPDQGKKDPKLP